MKRAIVLCGGGSLGSYEIGVWKYIKEANISFDIVTGTSIGAINGALFAAGDYENAVHLWNQVGVDKVIKNGIDFPRDFLQEFDWKHDIGKLQVLAKTYISNKGADISPFMDWVKKVVPVKDVKNSPVTLGVVTTSFPGRKEIDVVLNDVPEENILDYLHASSACYPVFPVYSFNGKSYIDGGYCNNLPIDFAIRLGAEEIIAVLLRAVPKVPQHKELMELPFVTTVRPSHDTGSIMNFNRDVCLDNMKLGYLDACKAFGKYGGYTYAFKLKKKDQAIASAFALQLVREFPNEYFHIADKLTLEDFKVKTSMDMLLRTLEVLGDKLGIDYLKVHSLHSFIKECLKIIKKPQHQDAGAKFALRKIPTLRLLSEDWPNLIYWAEYVFSKNQQCDRIMKIAHASLETAPIITLFSFLHSSPLGQSLLPKESK